MKNANWIWKKGENSPGTWMCFVKDFSCNMPPEKVTVNISVDSKYWLFINGKLTVFEGGLKRGPSPTSGYYDELIFDSPLVSGNNRIAILVWYFGKSGFNHVSSGRGGLYFEAEINGERIVSDNTWKIKKHTAYIPIPEDNEGPNFRLSENDIFYDAALEFGSWHENSYPVDDWESADVIDSEAFGKLYKRNIPQFKNYGIREFLNSSDVKGFYAKADTVLEMKLPYNLQFTPIMKLDAPAGKKILIKAENHRTHLAVARGIKSVYFTKDGIQEYESLGWLNGERIQFHIPEGVRVLELSYRETGYDTKRLGSFVCDDEFLNRLWEKCARTLYISMRDTFMDCPDRERTQWWGDVNIEMQMLLYCMDENASLLYEKGVDSLVGWYEATGNMLTVVPSGTEQFELPFQNLSGICGFLVYYNHKKDTEFLKKLYPMSKSYLLSYEFGDDGLVIHRPGSWDWPDWGNHADTVVMENAWYYLSLRALLKMAQILGYDDDASEYIARMKKVRENLLKKKTESGIFYGKTDNEIPDDRANALCILAGFAEKKDYGAYKKLFSKVKNSSPYMEKYVLDAMCEAGMTAEAVERIKERYNAMVTADYSTLWELWGDNASWNHAWTGGPLVTMSKYITGIRIDEEDNHKYHVTPNLCGLSYVRCEVPTALGILTTVTKRENEGGTVEVTVPHGIKAEVTVPQKWTVTISEKD